MIGQQIFTFVPETNFTIDASMGFNRVDIVPINSSAKFTITGSAPITDARGNVISPEKIAIERVSQTFTIQSSGNAPLSNIVLTDLGNIAIIGYM